MTDISEVKGSEKGKEITKLLPDDIRQVFAKSTCLYTKNQVDAALDKMATEISYRLSNTNPVFLCDHSSGDSIDDEMGSERSGSD